MATTFCHWKPHDEIFRSTNGGATWTQLWQTNTTEWDHSSAPYTATRTPHWMGTIVINPFNSDQVLFTTGLRHLELQQCDRGPIPASPRTGPFSIRDSKKPCRWR